MMKAPSSRVLARVLPSCKKVPIPVQSVKVRGLATVVEAIQKVSTVLVLPSFDLWMALINA
jgi:hypothetical protein